MVKKTPDNPQAPAIITVVCTLHNLPLASIVPDAKKKFDKVMQCPRAGEEDLRCVGAMSTQVHHNFCMFYNELIKDPSTLPPYVAPLASSKKLSDSDFAAAVKRARTAT